MTSSIFQETVNAQKALIDKLAPENIKAWVKEYFNLDMGQIHVIWFKHYLLNDKCKQLLLEAPMGHAKSTYVGVVYSIHLICQYQMNLIPKLSILLGGASLERAMDLLRAISFHLENNEKLINDYGPFKADNPEKWTEKIIYVLKSEASEHPTIRVTATESKTTGKRATHLIGDDIVDYDNSTTELQRMKVKRWFNSLFLTRLEPDGYIRIINTEYGEYTLTQDIIQKRNGLYQYFDTAVYKAIDEKENFGPKGELWPEYYNYDALMKKKANMSITEWELCYQNNPKAMEGSIFKIEHLKHYKALPPNLKIYQGIDLSISTRGDFFVIMTIGIDDNENIYIMDIYRDRITFPEQVKAIQTKNAIYKPYAIGIDSQAYQEAMPQHLRSISALPMKMLKTTKSKPERMIGLSYYFQNAKIWIPEPDVQQWAYVFIDELLSYTPTMQDHSPDQLDALDYALQVGLGQAQRKFLGEALGHKRKMITI